MSVPGIAAMAARYDDDAWAALASRGLLRRARKDLGILDVRVTGETDDGVQIAVGDKAVRITAAGPGAAECSCPSAVICQHIITAGLWLASQAATAASPPDQPGEDSTPAAGDEAEPDAGRLHEDLMAIGAAALTAYAGLAGYRWAHQMLDDLQAPPGVTRASYLTVTFERPPLQVRYLGGGLDSLVLSESVAHPQRFAVAAVLAWQRAHGLVLPPPPQPRRRRAGPGELSVSRAQSRERLRAAVSQLLRDMVAVGVSHLSPAIGERLTTAATWAQGAEYHRLARGLRRLADQADLLLARSALADDLMLLGEIAVTHALAAALDAAAAAGAEPAELVGRARTAYDPVRSLDLIGLGGRPWRSGSGYHGLTCVFWSPSRRQFLTWTDTRPDSLAGFDPRDRWQQAAPWTGLDTPAAASGCALTLTNAQISPDGRISGAESTAATVTAAASGELISQLPVHTLWQEAAPVRVHALSDGTGTRSHWAVLQPAHAGPALWDAAIQTLHYPLTDTDGHIVVLEAAWSRLHAHVIGRLETLGGDLAGQALVVAQVTRRGGRLTGEPLSLVLPGRPDHPVDALHFDDQPGRGPSALAERLLAATAADQPAPGGLPSGGLPSGGPGTPRAALPVPLADLRALIESHAQRGCAGVAPGVIHARVAQAHRRLRDWGMSVFAEPDPAVSAPETLLRSLFLVQQAEQALC